MNKNEVGRTGEDLAVQHLVSQGYLILDRNWRSTGRGTRESGERSNSGELDIVATRGGVLVGVEVKTRTSAAFGAPAAAITEAKIARLRRLMGQWLVANRARLPHFCEVRLDAIAILLVPSNNSQRLSVAGVVKANNFGAPAPQRAEVSASSQVIPQIEHLMGIS